LTARTDIARLRYQHVHRITLRVRDDRDTPLGGVDGVENALLVNRKEAKYFCGRGLDTVSPFEIADEIRFLAHGF
jgi:hypothetical protein